MDPIEEVQPLKLDNLGPIIINTDGSTSRIPNFHTFTEDEKAHAFKLIARRNEARRALLIEQRKLETEKEREEITENQVEILAIEDGNENMAKDDNPGS